MEDTEGPKGLDKTQIRVGDPEYSEAQRETHQGPLAAYPRADVVHDLQTLQWSIHFLKRASGFFSRLSRSERNFVETNLARFDFLISNLGRAIPDVSTVLPRARELGFTEGHRVGYHAGMVDGHKEGVAAAKHAMELEREPDPDEMEELRPVVDFAASLAAALRPFALREEVTEAHLDLATEVYRAYLERIDL